MATDWTARAKALEYFERQKRLLHGDGDEHVSAAIDALRRSQDHTAIQAKLTQALARVRELEDLLAKVET